ncbi:MAG TPA: hypothetical protein DIS74_09925 [Bacteroidales bacterium]|nr:hypothetical protein [Bacteroidales bacterium]
MAGGQTPDGPVFNITVEQNGSSDGETMVKNVKAGYWPCAIWNSGYFGGESFSDQSVMGAQTTATPEGLLARRGSIAGMKPGEVLLFYVREKSGTGNEGHCSATLSTIGDGVFSCTVVSGDDKGTYTAGGPVTEPGRRAFGPAGNANAIIKRTAEGAILTFSEPNLEAEGYCDFFGLFDGENTPEALPEVFTFKLTNDELKNWSTLQKVNDRTLPGPLGGSLHIRAVLTSGVFDEKKADVTLGGCSELSTGEQGQVNATGKPEGGSYRFWSEPQGMLMIESEGPSATLTGSRPGRGTLYVEYTTPDGSRTEASKPASVVGIWSYNGGNAIPPVPLYDVNGNKLSGKLTVPYSSEPEEAQELVDFVSGNPSVFTVVASAENLDIEVSKTGKATLEARDNCGNTAGPTVEVEVVNCDDETIARLENQRQAATENLLIATRELQKTAGSSEFEKARDDLVASTIDLLAKTGLTIISGGKTTGAVKTAAEMADVAAGLSDMLASGSHEEVYVNGVKAAAGKIWGEAASTLIGLGEVAAAADRFYENIAEIKLHEEALKSALESYEKALTAVEDVVRRQQICKRDKTQPQQKEEPKADPTPEPSDPKPPVDPKPKTDTPPAQKPPAEPPAPKPGDEDPPISPPPPASPPRQVGLPYSPQECGCDKTKSISVNSEGFSTLQVGVKNIGDCVENFNKTSVNAYANTLRELSALADSLKVAADGDPEIFRVQSTKAKPRLDSLIKQTQSYDEAGKTFLKEFEKCPESVTTGMEVLKSAQTVTVDSITTKY